MNVKACLQGIHLFNNLYFSNVPSSTFSFLVFIFCICDEDAMGKTILFLQTTQIALTKMLSDILVFLALLKNIVRNLIRKNGEFMLVS